MSQLTEVLRRYQPEAAAVEHTFVNKDAVATLKLGQARGIALLVPAQFGLAVGEYAPNAVKKTVVGVGHAAKVQVDHMVRLHLPGVDDRRAGCGGCAGDRDLPCASPAVGGPVAGGAARGRRDDRQDFRPAGLARAGSCADRRARRGLYRPCQRPDAGRRCRRLGEAVALYTDLLVREDLLQLFGFPTMLEKEWHKLLMTVQGVGAKASMAILGTLGAEGVARAITLGDARAIQAAPGVGPKLAQRVILELKAKAPGVMAMGAGLGAMAEAEDAVIEDRCPCAAQARRRSLTARRGGRGCTADALSALVNLGYGQGEAAQAVATVAGEQPEADTAALIRAALKLLAPKVS